MGGYASITGFAQCALKQSTPYFGSDNVAGIVCINNSEAMQENLINPTSSLSHYSGEPLAHWQ
jgi:hypothetical protein